MLLHQHFVQTAKKFGNKLAFIDKNTNRKITYSKALIAALILKKRFSKYREGFLGIMIPTSAGCALSIIASLMSGRTPVMINYSTGADRNAAYAQNKCGFSTIITSRGLLQKINCPALDGMVFIEDIMKGIGRVDKLFAALKSFLPLVLLQRMVHGGRDVDNAVILFTSGSEKDPKAVQLTHRNIVSNIRSASTVFDLNEDDRMLANLPYFHVFGLSINLWLPLYHGMTIIHYANPVDYKTVCKIIREEEPTMMVGTPSFLRGYLLKSEPGDFRSMRLVVSGADKCPDALREGFLEKHGIILYEGYGTTETSPVISANAPHRNRPGSVGRVVPDVEVRIEDLETGNACLANKVGRIMVKGDMLMKGYLDDFEETSMRIRQGWYDTGDMGYLDDEGYLWHAGRLKRFVKIGGEMVSLVKVEDVLEKFLPGEASCCVIEIPDAVKGGKIVAVVTEAINEKDIMKQMSEHLPNIALPRQFIVMEELPRMGSGKIDFRSVTHMVRQLLFNPNNADVGK
jgi:acyl-[acyl-carrier-protein]-phospholipid O-acyltransferase/long-chain-fatty-acid--[acyl-carrier-protein] ligase